MENPRDGGEKMQRNHHRREGFRRPMAMVLLFLLVLPLVLNMCGWDPSLAVRWPTSPAEAIQISVGVAGGGFFASYQEGWSPLDDMDNGVSTDFFGYVVRAGFIFILYNDGFVTDIEAGQPRMRNLGIFSFTRHTWGGFDLILPYPLILFSLGGLIGLWGFYRRPVQSLPPELTGTQKHRG